MNFSLQSDRIRRIIALSGAMLFLLACNAGAETTQAPAPANPDAPLATSPAPVTQTASEAPAATPTGEPTQAPSDTPAPTDTPTATASATQRPIVPSATRTPSELSFVWEIIEAGANPDNSNEWRVVVSITASGGDGKYHYYHDALPLDDSIFEVFWEACKSKPGSMTVEDGSGRSVEEKYFLNAPYCNKTPTPTP
jgi:hypothetical protein